jgi:hypothetical protein
MNHVLLASNQSRWHRAHVSPPRVAILTVEHILIGETVSLREPLMIEAIFRKRHGVLGRKPAESTHDLYCWRCRSRNSSWRRTPTKNSHKVKNVNMISTSREFVRRSETIENIHGDAASLTQILIDRNHLLPWENIATCESRALALEVVSGYVPRKPSSPTPR